MKDNSTITEYHLPCKDCGSSDALSKYSDGHTFCFSCKKTTKEESSDNGRTTKSDTSNDNPFHDVNLKQTNGRPLPLLKGGCGEYLQLSKRKISEDTCRKFGYLCIKGIGQVAPYYDEKGVLVAQKVRGPNKKFSCRGDLSKSTLFGQNLWGNKKGSKRIVITEGEIDCMSVAQVFNLNWPVVSIPNGTSGAYKALSKNLEFLECFEDIVLFFDNDKPGKGAMEECVQLFSPGKVRIVCYQGPKYKDSNDLLQGGHTKEIANMVFNAKVSRPDGIIEGHDLKEELWDFFKGKGNKGYSLPFPKELQEMTDGIRKGELWTFTAGTKVGKSTVVNEIAAHLMNEHGLTIGVVALEEGPLRTCLRYLAIELNCLLHRKTEGVTDEMFSGAYDKMLNNNKFYLYNHFGSLNSDVLIDRIKYMIVGMGCDFIVFDHISIAVSGLRDGDERRIIDNLMTDLRSLVENTGAGCLVVSHLNRAKGSTPFEEGGQVSLANLRGSGAIAQISDTIIAFERNLQDKEDNGVMKVRLLACRHTGESGEAGYLRYNKKTGRIEEYKQGEGDF